MTATVEQQVCGRCHGTGVEPKRRTPTVPDVDDQAQRELLEQLQEAGKRRAQYSRARNTAGRIALDKAYEDIRVLAAEAERLYLGRQAIAEAVGVGRAALYNILSGKAGG